MTRSVYSLALGLLADLLITSPTLTLLQAVFSRRILTALYEDLRNSRMGFYTQYSHGKPRPIVSLRHKYEETSSCQPCSATLAETTASHCTACIKLASPG